MDPVELSAPRPMQNRLPPGHRSIETAGLERAPAKRAATHGLHRFPTPVLAAGAVALASCVAAAGIKLEVRSETVLARPTILAHEEDAVFGDNARHVAYPVGGREQRVCLDGVEGKGFDLVTNLTFSPDGERLAYWALTRTNVLVVVDGKEAKAPVFDSAGAAPVFSPDSRHFAYWVKRRGEWHVIRNAAEGKGYRRPGFPLRFGEDSRYLATAAVRDDGGVVAVVDGVEGPVFEHIFRLAFDGPSRIRLLAQRRQPNLQKEWVRVELDIVTAPAAGHGE